MREVKQSEMKVPAKSLRVCVLFIVILSVLGHLSFTSVYVDAADPYEPDDDPAQATNISVNGTLQSHDFDPAGEEDWFNFTAISGKYYIMETHNLSGGANTYLYLYDTDGIILIDEDDDGGIQNLASRIAWIATGDGYFYLMCKDTHTQGGSYEINITESDPPPADTFEPDNEMGTATVISTDGSTQNHSFHISGDEDWLKFSAENGTVYAIETLNLTGTDTYLYLYDTDGFTLLEEDDNGGVGAGSYILWTSPGDGTYYIRAIDLSGSAGPDCTYEINVSIMILPEPPGPPANLTVTSGDSFINLSWEPPTYNGTSDITNYMIHRNTTSGAKYLLSEIGNQNYYNDTSVSNFVTYYYDVCAKSPDGEGNVSNEVSIFPYLLPSSPTSLSAESRDDFINLSWNPPVTDGGSPIVNYTIYRRYLFGKNPIAKVANITFYNDTDIFSGFTYHYSVSASNIGGEGTLSDEIVAKIILPPGVPWFITTSIGDSYCLLNWSKPFSSGGSPITNYRIYRSTISGEEEFLAETGNSTFYNDTSVTTGITYYYKISAKNIGGEGDLSEEISAKLGTLPQAPTNLEAVSGSFMGVSVVTLSWDPPADTGGIPITNYKIYRGTSSGDLSFLANAGNLTVYVDSDVKKSERYYYKVVAQNDMGLGVSSSEINTSPEDITTTSILALLALFGIIGFVIVVIIVVMVFRKKKAKKKAEEEAQIGFEGGAWDQAQQPQPGFSPDQPPMEGYPAPAMPQPGSEGQNTLIYICPHCQEKYSAQRPSQSLIVTCPKCNGQSVIDPIT